jgi:hypothetical protein
MALKTWAAPINFDTPAGRVLQRLVSGLPKDRAFHIVVFRSAPLQMLVDPRLVSADVDIITGDDDICAVLRNLELVEGMADLYVQVSSELTFQTSPRWKDRALKQTLGNCTFIFPHPVDILIAKLHRLEEKDLNAFRAVLQTGHPTEAELIEELQAAVDLFRPNFDEERSGDFTANTRKLWPLLFGREINPAQDIIAPALARRRAGYGDSSSDFKEELREAARKYGGQRL